MDGELGALYDTLEDNEVPAASFGRADELIAKAEKRIKEWTRVLLGIDTCIIRCIDASDFLIKVRVVVTVLDVCAEAFSRFITSYRTSQGLPSIHEPEAPHWMCVIVCGFC